MSSVAASPESGRLIDWGVAGRALAGADVSGDRHMVVPRPGGVLLGLADGLGHGPEAAVAAQAAAEVFARFDGQSVTEMMKMCDDALRPTRGAVLSMASISAASGSVEWLGVGNVEGVLIHPKGARPRTREFLLLRGGVVGYRMPRLRSATLQIAAGDMLIFASDGIASDFALMEPDDQSAQELADRILLRHGTGTDDALVLVVRYLGTAP